MSASTAGSGTKAVSPRRRLLQEDRAAAFIEETQPAKEYPLEDALRVPVAMGAAGDWLPATTTRSIAKPVGRVETSAPTAPVVTAEGPLSGAAFVRHGA